MVRALLVVVGLLGEAPDPAWFLRAPAFAKAGVLGTVFADPAGAQTTLEALLRRTSHPAVEEILSDALREVEGGEWLGAVR